MPDRWAPLRRLLEMGSREGVYTGAVALVGFKGDLQWQAAVGGVARDPEAPPVTPETLFDLASLTKPLATALSLLLLKSRGEIALTATLGEILPDEWLPRDKRPLTVYDLLAHRAGLPAWQPFYEQVLAAPPARRPGMLARLAAATPLEELPENSPEDPAGRTPDGGGARTLYSDLGYMLLQAVIEQVGGQDLDDFCRQEIYRPLGLNTLGFCPRRQPGGDAVTYAATEPGLIPGRCASGEVHDENAWAAGGVAGHAGLFGNGGEVFELLAALYRAYQGQEAGLFAPDDVRLFLTPALGASRTLGFDTPEPGAAQRSAGRFFSQESVGHLGFTGTSFWLDLKLAQMVVLLTNRVHLGRDNLDKIRAFRPQFHEAASRALGFIRIFRS